MPRIALGTVRSLSVTCLSETAWHNPGRMRKDVAESGGLSADQYDVAWTPGNGAGVSALMRATDSAGAEHAVLIDCGWDADYMDLVFRREGVDRMLLSGAIERLVVTHEHVDHFFGLPAVVKYCPGIEVVIPASFTARGKELIARSGHKGRLVEMPPGATMLFPGCAAATFPQPIFLKIQGELVLYVNLEKKGLVALTGCCHPGVMKLLDFAKETFEGFDAFYGVYGGLHIAPFEEWGEAQDALVENLAGYGLSRLACNHCTGVVTVQKMLARGLNVVRGRGANGSTSDLYLGNGDTVEF